MALVGSDIAAPRLPFLTDNNVLSSPAVANGVVYVGSQDSVDVNLYAINAATGPSCGPTAPATSCLRRRQWPTASFTRSPRTATYMRSGYDAFVRSTLVEDVLHGRDGDQGGTTELSSAARLRHSGSFTAALIWSADSCKRRDLRSAMRSSNDS